MLSRRGENVDKFEMVMSFVVVAAAIIGCVMVGVGLYLAWEIIHHVA